MEPPGMEMNTLDFPKNPLLCPICHDYFTEPCILSCYHTFCARCLRGREQDRRLICPFCRQATLLKDGSMLPPPDTLMRQLIDIANSENPPCSNCDKRDRSNMYYCNTCGQALCSHCRDNTHRAKMFATHEVVHMTKCGKEPKRCPQHGEQYIMYSQLQNAMLCVNCFRDLPNELRAQCSDIETAHLQAAKRLERGQTAIMDLQTSVRDGIIALKNLMDELRRNMDSEKHTINTFCQGMQEAMAKTHAAMIMEVQRQFESKDRIYRSQLLVLGTVMPVLQLHLVLCTTFTAAANKYQFLELCPMLIERLSAVGNLSQPVRALQSSMIKTNYRSEFAQCLEPWIGPAAVSQHQSEMSAAAKVYDLPPPPQSIKKQQVKKLFEVESSFSSHCRSFEHQIRELNQQFNQVKEKVGELHRDLTALRKAQTPPLSTRYDILMRECLTLDESLEKQQGELDKMATNFDLSWEEQLWRLKVEQEVFNCQRADLITLRNELKHLSQMAAEMEPYIRSTSQSAANLQQQTSNEKEMQSLLEHFSLLQQQQQQQQQEGKIPRSRSRVLGQFLEKVRPNIHERERSKSVAGGQTSKMDKKIGLTATQQLNIDRLEAHIKEKLHDMICRQGKASSKSDPETSTERKLTKDDRKLSKTDLDSLSKLVAGGGKQRIMYKKIGKSCDKLNSTCGSKSDPETKCGKTKMEGDYQRISDATTSQNVKALVHKETRSSPSSPKCKKQLKQSAMTKGKAKKSPKKVYPYSDGEDNVFYSLHDSADSLSTSSRRSSFEGGQATSGAAGGPDKTLVVVINRRNKNMSLAQKQRSWETFPPKRRHHMCHSKLSAPNPMPIRKADSFEGHEEAVKSLVAAVQETRRKPKSGGGAGN